MLANKALQAAISEFDRNSDRVRNAIDSKFGGANAVLGLEGKRFRMCWTGSAEN